MDPLLSLPPREFFLNRYKTLIYTAQNDVSLRVNCKEISEAYTYETQTPIGGCMSIVEIQGYHLASLQPC